MSTCRLCGCDGDAPISASWEFFIPVAAQSQNRLVNRGLKRFRYAAVRTDFLVVVMAESRRLRIPRAKAKRRVTMTRLYGKGCSRFDHGNLVGGMKPLLDVLVSQALLVDDSERFVEDHYRQEPLPREDPNVGVVVLVEEFA